MMIICVVVSAGLSTPLLKFLHKPSGRYISHKIRTIQHAKSDSNIKILACVYDEDNVPALINLLRSFHATIESPLKIFLLHLVNLVGRAAPLLIEHSPDPRLSNRFTPVHYLRSEHIIAAFKRLESDQITVESFTSISPFSTMHHDVCKLALDKKVNMVIAPFHEKDTAGFCHSDSTDRAIRAINCNILVDSPCSTAILIDRGQLKQSIKRVAVLFFGGADDREALACAARMIDGSEISLATIIRLRPEDESSNVPEDNQLDDDFLNNFRVQYGDKESVRYMEEKVKDAEAVMRIIRAMENICDLLIVGNRKGEESPLMAGMEEWSERPELGIIGDIVASSDFKDKFSVFVVVQQQRKVGISFTERIQ